MEAHFGEGHTSEGHPVHFMAPCQGRHSRDATGDEGDNHEEVDVDLPAQRVLRAVREDPPDCRDCGQIQSPPDRHKEDCADTEPDDWDVERQKSVGAAGEAGYVERGQVEAVVCLHAVVQHVAPSSHSSMYAAGGQTEESSHRIGVEHDLRYR